MKFSFIDRAKSEFPVRRLCDVLEVSQSGYCSWKSRPACRRQHEDMVLLAHVRSAFALSNGTYGSPRMVQELRDNGLAVGRRRTARLMRENGLEGRQNGASSARRIAITYGPSPLISLSKTSVPPVRMRNGVLIFLMSGPARDGCIWRW
jgi:hypothetical protein